MQRFVTSVNSMSTCKVCRNPIEESDKFYHPDCAATKIQKIYRGYNVRVNFPKIKVQLKATKRLKAKLRVEIPKGISRLRKTRPVNQSIDDMQFNIYSEFSEFSRKQLDRYTELFNTYDIDGTGKLTVEGLKRMMEKLGLPQTHLQMKALIKEVDNDKDGMISLKDFITLFRRRNKGELLPNSVTTAMVNIFNTTVVDVREVGVTGAKAFFEGKASIKEMKTEMALKEIHDGAEHRKEVRAEKAERAKLFETRKSNFEKPSDYVPRPSIVSGGVNSAGNKQANQSDSDKSKAGKEREIPSGSEESGECTERKESTES